MTNALDELREMHVAATSAFKKIASAAPAERGQLWSKLRPELLIHEKIEEQFVYDPVARDVGSRDATLKAWEGEHEQQAQEADAVIARIDKLDPAEADWLNSLHSLASMLERHIAHEEQDIWPKIEREWGNQNLGRAGRPIAVAKHATTSGSSVEDAFNDALEAQKGE